MRTTLTLGDDAFAQAQTYARANAMRLGEAVSELIERGMQITAKGEVTIVKKGEFYVFQSPPGTPVLTSAQVREMMDAE
jgi:hypothetical protein